MSQQLTVLNSESINNLPALNKWQLKQESAGLICQAVTASLHEQARAHLAQTALENVGALSSLEQHLTQIAPCGAERYKHIVDAYALGAAKEITRW